MGLSIYLNGRFVPEEEAKVSVFDHGYLYGDGVFEGIRAYNGKVFRLEQHVERLFDSAKAINLKIPYTEAEIGEVVCETCRRNNLRDAYIRLVISRGKGALGLDPRNCPEPTTVCIASSITLYPPELYMSGLDVITIPTRRNIAAGVTPRIKSLNYLNNIMAKIEAAIAGVQEAIMLTQEGYLAECTGDNMFMVRDGVIKTPTTHLGMLQGVTRDAVIELARKRGIAVEETVLTRYDFFTAHECWLTGTAAEMIPVVKIDNRVIGDGRPGPVYAALLEDFRALVQHDGAEI